MTKGRLGRLSDHTGHNASKRRAGPETLNAEADPRRRKGKAASGREVSDASTDRFRPVGMAVACMEEGIGRNTGSPAGGVARANRQPARVRLGRVGWRRGPQYQGSWVMPVEEGTSGGSDGEREQARGTIYPRQLNTLKGTSRWQQDS